MTEVEPELAAPAGTAPRFGAVEAGGTKFVCLVGSSPDDVVAKTRIPTGADPATTLAAVVRFFADSPAPAAVGGPQDGAPTLSAGAGTAIAGVCLLAVAAIVVYGLYIIIA